MDMRLEISTPIGKSLSLHPGKNYPYRWIYALEGPLCETLIFVGGKQARLQRSFRS